MKPLFTFILSAIIAQASVAQSGIASGKYEYSNAGHRISLVIHTDNTLSLYTGSKTGTLVSGDYRQGSFVMVGELMRITWSDGAKEKKTIKSGEGAALHIVLADHAAANRFKEYVLAKVE